MKIVCVEHSSRGSLNQHEGNDSSVAFPVFFIKPDSALMKGNSTFYIPDFSSDIYHKCNIVVRISRICKSIDKRFAHRAWNGLSMGLDFTAFDVLQKCEELKLPCDLARAFDNSALVSDRFFAIEELPDEDVRFYLNDKLIDTMSIHDLTDKVNAAVSEISRYVTLKVGDLVFVGIGSSCAQLVAGDRLRGVMSDCDMFDFEVK